MEDWALTTCRWTRPGGFSPKGIRPQAIPDSAKQTMLNLKLQNLEATITQQQHQIEMLTAQLKEQVAQIQKVNAQIEMNKPAAKVIVNKPKAVLRVRKTKKGNEQKMKNRSTILLAILPVLACFALLPGARAVNPAPDGCFPNFTTAEGCDALSSLTTGAGNTALGWRRSFSIPPAVSIPVLALER